MASKTEGGDKTLADMINEHSADTSAEHLMRIAPDEVITRSVRGCGCDFCCEAAARRIESYAKLMSTLGEEIKFQKEHNALLRAENEHLTANHHRLVSRLCASSEISPPGAVIVTNDG